MRAQGDLRRRQRHYLKHRASAENLGQFKNTNELYLLRPPLEAQLYFEDDCQLEMRCQAMLSCLVPSQILIESIRKRQTLLNKSECCVGEVCTRTEHLTGLAFLALWFLKHHLPCARLGLGDRFRGSARQHHVSSDASWGCCGCCRCSVFFLLLKIGIGAFWKLFKPRGGHSAARQGLLTGSAGGVPV